MQIIMLSSYHSLKKTEDFIKRKKIEDLFLSLLFWCYKKNSKKEVYNLKS